MLANVGKLIAQAVPYLQLDGLRQVVEHVTVGRLQGRNHGICTHRKRATATATNTGVSRRNGKGAVEGVATSPLPESPEMAQRVSVTGIVSRRAKPGLNKPRKQQPRRGQFFHDESGVGGWGGEGGGGGGDLLPIVVGIPLARTSLMSLMRWLNSGMNSIRPSGSMTTP